MCQTLHIETLEFLCYGGCLGRHEIGHPPIWGDTLETRTYQIHIETNKAPEFIDITDQVLEFLRQSNVSNGLAIIYSKHTTAAIRINEHEPLLLQDMEDFIERISPRTALYRHNDFSIRTVNMTDDEYPNGHAHCQHLLFGSSENIPIIEGNLQLGRWQRIFLIELDTPRPRTVLIQIIG